MNIDVTDKSRQVFLEENEPYLKITMNYYEKRNTFSEEFGRQFSEVLAAVGKKRQNIVIITGVKDCFCAGANLQTVTGKGFDVLKYLVKVKAELDRMEKSQKIFISAVNGHCVGGGLELALATDYVIASKDSVVGLPEVLLGLVPGADGIKRLTRQIGRRRALELMITGKLIKAAEGERIGIINETVPRRKLMSRAEELAGQISRYNPEAVSTIKQLTYQSDERDISKDEINGFRRCLKTKMTQDSIKAFLDRKVKK